METSQKKLFLIIGAPGSGKTTDAEIIAKQNSDITHYSTGEMFRSEIKTGSEIGKVLDSFISKGLIVPIEIAIKTITNAIKSAPTSVIIIDGYPRSVEQLEALDVFLQNDKSILLSSVIEVSVSDDTAKERVLGRSRGDDDKIEVFNNRMKIYNEPLKEIKNFYISKKILHTISGEDDIQTVVEKMQNHITSKI